MNIVSARLLSQQLSCPLFSHPYEVVSHMGAMQAQEYRLMRWAVAMRTKRPSVKDFEADYNAGRIVRAHLHRATWQLMAADDYHWMRMLCAPKAVSTTLGWMHSNGIHLSEEEIRTVRRVLLPVVERKKSVTKEDFEEALKDANMQMDDHRLSYHIRMGELDGVLCSGDLLPMKASYSLVEDKIPAAPSISRDEALMRLARKYLQGHAPATLEDFVWWSGLGVADCRKALALLGTELHREKGAEREWLYLDTTRTRGSRKAEALLLPSYDEYLIGYKSRDVVLDPVYRHHAHNQSGIFYPVILESGQVVGNWAAFKASPEPAYFDDSIPHLSIEREWGRYSAFRK